ncbi:FAD-dependent oxidoreductase [bacterium]|nr:FAD-dependent oxidoreductase [bacterium]
MSQTHYDVLVIGSGMGGMTSAAILSKAGFTVLVVERDGEIGGQCSTMPYKGFKCIKGAVGIGTKGITGELFKSLEIKCPIREAGALHFLIKGRVCEVSSQNGLKSLLNAAGAGQVAITNIMNALSTALQWRFPSREVCLYDWIQQYSNDPGILEIFETLVGAALMVNLKEISARYFFEFVKELNDINSFGYCPHGSGELPETVGRFILENNGDIWTRTTVTKILTDKGVVQGAVLRNREREFVVTASVVISDIGIVRTAQFTGKENFDQTYLQELSRIVKPSFSICLQFALNEPLFPGNHLLITGANSITAVYQPTIVCPELAPPGKHLLIATAAPSPFDPTVEGKERIDLCLGDLRTLFPGFDARSEVLQTSIKQGELSVELNGYEKDLTSKMPIINLYNVETDGKHNGYGGLHSVIKSGVLVAEEINQRMGFQTVRINGIP